MNFGVRIDEVRKELGKQSELDKDLLEKIFMQAIDEEGKNK